MSLARILPITALLLVVIGCGQTPPPKKTPASPTLSVGQPLELDGARVLVEWQRGNEIALLKKFDQPQTWIDEAEDRERLLLVVEVTNVSANRTFDPGITLSCTGGDGQELAVDYLPDRAKIERKLAGETEFKIAPGEKASERRLVEIPRDGRVVGQLVIRTTGTGAGEAMDERGRLERGAQVLRLDLKVD
jgi:hypothetical protein